MTFGTFTKLLAISVNTEEITKTDLKTIAQPRFFTPQNVLLGHFWTNKS